jgi:glucose-6-phosphate dehydrogenase assembly protein OpcA
MPGTLDSEQILRQLAELWTSLARPEHGVATASGVLRACAMTLIVAAEHEADAVKASETVAELIHEHPSRAIVLKPSAAGELDARVFAQCWMPFGSRQQICCEQIEIAAAPDRLGDVPGLMLGLLAPDLPVVLWCRGERWFNEPHFGHMLPLIDKLIVDSSNFTDAARAFAIIGELMSERRSVADLEWSRLTGWREVIAHAFDSPADLERAGDTKSIRIVHGGAAPMPDAYYLAAWLKRAMPQAGVSFQSESGHEGIVSVALDQMTFRLSGTTVEIGRETETNTAVLTRGSDCTAMREELSITRRDRIYEQVYTIAKELSGLR